MVNTIAAVNTPESASGTGTARDWEAVARELGPQFAARAAAHDADDSFVSDNYVELKAQRIFSAGIPRELGGGGASYRELCAMLRTLGQSCGSTALALSMHTHLVATTVWRLKHGQPAEGLLRRVAEEQLVLVSTGASDWLESNGTSERVDGGYRANGRKIFSSGSPAGSLLMTSIRHEDPTEGPVVLHCAIPMNAPGVTVLDNWRTMGMRGTGSNDVLLENVFVPDAAVSMRRPQAKWHAFFAVVSTVALPLVMSVYLGVADAAATIAVASARKRMGDPNVPYLLGEMENALVTADMAVQGMVDLCNEYDFEPSTQIASAALIRKTIAANACIQAVEKALEATGGGGFFRSAGLERLLRDVHAARFHPLQEKRQHLFTGRVSLGLDPVG